jgi:hypothetical protein
MNQTFEIAIAAAAAMVFTAAALAQTPGMGQGHGAAGHRPMMGQGMGHNAGAGDHGSMAGPTAMLTKQDSGSAADMNIVMDLVQNNAKIRRTVTKLPDGIRTITESDDPKVAQDIKVVAALQGHAGEVTELVQDGSAGMRRGMMARMAMGPGGPRGAMGSARQGKPAPSEHSH